MSNQDISALPPHLPIPPNKGDNMVVTSMSRVRTRILITGLALLLTSLTACDSDSSGRGRNNGIPSDPVRVQGTVQAGPAQGVTVVAFAVDSSGNKAQTLGQSSSDANGNFQIVFNNNSASAGYSGVVLLEATGGTYTDEARQSTVTLGAVFKAVIDNSTPPANASFPTPVTANVTILSTLAAEQALRGTGGLTQANVLAANASINSLYNNAFDILSTPLSNPNDPAGGSNLPVDSGDFTVALAGFSRLALDLGLTPDQLYNALIADITDGRLDGRSAANTSTLVDDSVITRLARSTAAYVASNANVRNLSIQDTTLAALTASDGNISRNNVPGLDTVGPKVIEHFPLPGATNVFSNSKIFIRVNEELDPSTVTSSSVTVRNSTGSIPGTLSYDSASQSIVFTPATILPTNSTITINTTTDVQDLAGNALQTSDNFTFTTGILAQGGLGFATNITAVPPANTSADINQVIALTFDRPLDPSSLRSSGNVTLMNGADPINFSIGYNLATNTVILAPTVPLPNSTTITVGLSGSLLDAFGNLLSTAFSQSFTTNAANVADSSAPTVLAIDPANGSNLAQSSSQITVNFSEAVDAASVIANTQLRLGTNLVSVTKRFFSRTSSLVLIPDAPLSPGQTYVLTVGTNVLDLAGNSLSTPFTSSFTVTSPALTITTTSLPTAVVNQVYSQQIQSIGGNGAITFTATGSLPTGLTLSPAGVISGTPTIAGTVLITVTATDSSTPTPQTASQALSVRVNANVPVPTVSFNQLSSATNDEATQNFLVQIRLDSPSTLTSPVTAQVTVVGGTATNGTDYLQINTIPVSFPVGTTSGTLVSVGIGVLQDTLAEGDETIQLLLSNVQGSGAILGGSANHTVTITDDDPNPTVSLSSANILSLTEGASSTIDAVLSNPSAQSITVPFTVGGTASAATDHSLAAGNFVFAPGQSTATVSFQTTGDILDEDDIETITVTLGTPTAGATLGSPSTQTININDDDALAIVSVDSLTNIDEGSGTATFTISLNTPHGRSSPVTVNASTVPGTALSNTDFSSNTGTFSFAAGETSKSFMVSITDDTLDEDPESFTVVLGNANLLTISSAGGTGVGTIIDNDNPPNVSFAMATQSISEDVGTVTLTVSLDNTNGSGKAITVPFSVTGTAMNPADHNLASGQFPVIPATSIPPGQNSASVSFNVVDDNISELTETIIVTLGTPTNAGLGANPVLTINLNDNEAAPTANLDVLLGANVQNPNVANGNRIEILESAGTVTLRASISNPSSQDVTGSFTLGAGSSTSQPPEVTDLDTPGTRVRLYVGQNNGSGTVEAYTAFNGAPFTTELQNTVTPGNNQNVTLDTLGNLYQTGNVPPSVRVITDIANRPANDPFDPNKGDRIIVGAATTLVGPRGLDVDTRRERMLIADFNGTKLVVFDLKANGNVAPLGSTDLSVITGVTGSPWDLDYESQDDLLFVAMTDGNVLVYENYLGSGTFGSAGPTRIFAPTDGTNPGDNIHGIIYNRVRNELYLSDVGAATQSTSPGFDTDGRIFVIQNANTVGGAAGTTVTAAITINTGANVRLGNPVDISFDGGNLYVVEKTDSSTVPTDTNKILIYGGFQATVDAGVSGDIAPTATIVLPASAAPESSAIDPGTRLDHNFSTRSFTIPAGQTSATTSFRISEDTRDEENESIDLSLTMLNNATPGTNAARSIQVQDNDVQPTININSITNSEGNNAVLTVSLTAAPGRPVTVNFSTLDGTAVSVANPPFPEDFTAIPTTTLTLNEGENFKTITVIINDDANNEAPEDFTVNLSNNPSNALPGMLTGTVTIADNDALPVIDIAAVGPTTVDESVGQITFNVTLNAQSGQTVTANVLVAGVSNTFGAGDFAFTPNPSTVTFAPGETSKSVTVTINDDMLNEINEQFTASLANISATAAPGTTSTTITINDNDSFTVTLGNPSTGTEGGADASFTVTLSRESEQTLTLDVASLGVAPDPAEAGDFNSPASITFSPGTVTQTLTLAVIDDMVNEATETVQSTLSFAQAPNGFDMAGSTLINSVNINDNDELTVTLTTGTAGAEPSTNATFTATLNRQSEQTPITFDITTGANTADPTEPGDITAPASVTFSGMSTSETVTVTVNDDMINEATEGFSLTLALNGTVNLFSPSNSTLSANNTVADDDTVTVVLANTVPGMEPSTNLTYSATLSRQSEQTLNFNIAATGSGVDPAESTDFTVGTASISFAPGTITQSFDITVNDDGNNEAIEGLTTSLTLTNTVNGFDTQGSTLSAMAVINDDDLAVISITAQAATASAIENSNTIQLFDVAISVPTEQSLTVDFVGEAGTPVGASPGTDFQLPTGTRVSFPGSSATPFSTTQTVNIAVLEDLINEANEVYNIRLVNLAGAINGVSLATTPFASATILDDDPVSVLLSTTTNGMENSAGTPSNVTFTATLSRQSEQTINFDVTAMGSGTDPAEPTDFTLATTAISFAPLSLTRSITVTVNEDAINEANEGLTSTIALSNVVNGFNAQGSTLMSSAIINDDDNVTISIMTNTGPFLEGNVGDTNTVLFTVSISGDSEQAPMVNFATGTTTTAATDTGDAIADTDFTSQTGSLTLNLAAMTRTITVDLIEDNVAEQNENFLTALTLNTTARGVTLGNASATATITDDDNADISFGASTPVLEGATIPVQVNLSGPKSQTVTVELRDTLGGNATNGIDSTEEDRLFPYTPVALYVVRNNGGATGVDRLGTDLRLQATYDIGANEGSVLDTDGTLYVCSDANGVASIRSFNKIAGRAPSAAFDPNQDDIVLGAMTTLTNPKGIDLDTNRNLVFAADNGASEIKVFRLNDSGNVSPQGTTSLSERPWDIDYNSATDQLFVVTTSGNVFVFDNYVAGNFAPSGTPTKVITPADGGVKDSINLHGIAFDSANDRLILSDVGIPADATDGAIYVINNVSTASGLVEYDVKVSGANTMLGNPVDLAFDGTNIYIAEKSNNFVGIFALASLTGGHTNNDVAPNAQTPATRPESVTLDRGVRRDHDLTEAASTLTFAPGETSKTFNVRVIDDIRDEPIAPELLELTLENQTGPSNIATVTQNFQLADNDAAPGISIESVTALEGVGNDPTNPGTFVFVIRLDAPSGQPAGSLPNGTIATIDGTATVADNDYTALNGSFDFAEGSVYVTRVVTINDDATNEADETFTVRLDTVLFATPNGPIDTTGTITNDDGVPSVSVALAAGSAAGVSENGGGTLDFVVTLAPASGQPATVQFSTLTTGTATAGSDFTAISNQTLTFLPGQSLTQTVSVAISDDMINEDNETVIVQLSSPSNAVIDPGATTATGTINDNDDITVSIVSGATLAMEGDTGTTASLGFGLTLSGPSEQTVQVRFSTDGTGTATAGTDYTAVSLNTVSFAPLSTSATANVTITGDNTTEINEVFGVMLDNVAQGRGVTLAAGQSTSTGTINDNDPFTVSIGSAGAVTEGGDLLFPVTIDGGGKTGFAIGQTITVDFSTNTMGVVGDPAEPGDFSGAGTLTFSEATPGTLVMMATVTTVDDAVNELNESLNATLDAVTGNGGSLGATVSAGGTINDNDDITVNFSAATVLSFTEGDAGTTPASVELVLSGDSEQTINVDFLFQENTPASARGTAPNQDFVPNNGQVTVTTTPVAVSFEVVGDLLDEIDPETLTLALSGLTARGVTFQVSGVTSQNTTININDNDDAPDLSFDVANTQTTLSEAEADGMAQVQFSINAVSGQDVTFSLAVDGTSTASSVAPRIDFTDPTQTLTIPAGQTTVTIQVPINNDLNNEANETIVLSISNPMAATINGLTTGTALQTITINDDDALVVSIDNPNLTERDAGQNDPLNFTVSLNRDTEQTVTVQFVTADNTALNVGVGSGDYEAGTGTVTFDGVNDFGNRTQTIPVQINGDDINEPQETFTVTLSTLNVPGTITPAVGTGTIFDNDPLQISIGDQTLAEDSGNNFQFSVTFDRASEQVILVDFVTDTANVMGDPAEPADITGNNGRLTFAPLVQSQSLTINLVDDNINEADEQFQVILTINGTPDNVSFADNTALGTITDNDDVRVDLTTPITISEAQSPASFPLQLTDIDNPPAIGATEQTIQVLVQTGPATMGLQAQGDLTPQAFTDFLTKSQVLTFNATTTTQTFDVTIVDDAALPINEPTEFFDVNLSAQGQLPRGVTIGSAKETGTIVDNDIVTITITPPAAPILEGSNGGSTVANFVVTLTGRTTQTIVVDYMAESGGPNPGTPNLDYVPATNTLTLQADTVNAMRTVLAPVNIVADTINETDQSFQVRIALNGILSGVQIPTPTALGTIIDDDPVTIRVVNNNPVVPSVDQVREANGPAQFQVIVVGTDPSNPATFTEQTFSVDFTTADGTAVQPGDYTATTQTVTVAGLATNAVALGTTAVAVPVISDTINETNETFTSAIGNLQGSTNLVTIDAGAAGTTVTIIDDDILVVNLRSRDVLTNEGADSFFELFVDTNNPLNTATGTEQSFTFSFVTMQTTPIQAADNVDFMAINTPVTVTTNAINPFVLEQTLATQTVSTIDEQAGQQINEPNEDFLGVASNLMNANNVQFTGQGVSVTTNQTILDNDVIVFNITPDAPATERDAGGAALNVTFNVAVTGGSDLTAQTFNVPVQIGLMGDTAIAGADYDAAAATITPDLMFNGGPDVVPTNVAIVVPILFDDINEATESFRVALGTPTNMPANVSIGTMSTATQVILDDDVIVFDLAISQASASEAVTNRTFDLVLNAGTMATATAQAFNVDLTPLPGVGANPAMAPGDFSATPDTEMFDGTMNPATIAGRQLSVTVIDDGLNEQDEDFRAMISLPMAVNGVSINTATATGIILDNDDIVLNYAAGSNNQTIQERGNDGAQMANYAFNFSGATMSQQTIVVSVTAIAGLTPPSANNPGLANRDYRFIDPAGAGQNVTTLNITIPAGTDLTQLMTYMTDAIDDVSGDENPESYRLTTAVTGRGVSVATAGQNLDGIVRDVPLLNLNGAGILAVTPFGASFNTSTTPLPIAPNAVVVNNGQNTSAALLTVDLMGNSTLPGDEVSVVPGNNILVVGTDIFFNGSPIATTVTNPAAVTTAGGSAQLQVAMLNNISQAATQALIRQIGFRDNNASGGGRSVTTTFTFNTGGGQATEARDARVTINGAFNVTRLIVGNGNAAQGGMGSVPVSLSAIPGDNPVGAQMTVTYPTDGGNISASSVTIDPAIGTDHIVSAFNVSTPGVVTFQIISGSNTVLPSTRIANINFTNAAGTTLGSNPLQVTAASLADAAAAPIPVVGVDGTLNIVPVIVLTAGTVSGGTGTTVPLPIDITTPMGSTPVAVQIDIMFDAGVANLNANPTVGVDIIPGASATNAGAIIGVSNIAGGIRVVVASLSNQTLESGRLFDINFQLNAGSTAVTLNNIVVSDSNLNTLPNQAVNGSVTVN